MKRKTAIGGFVLSLLVFTGSLATTACEIPSTVVIKGSPSLKFATNVEFGELFSDISKDSLFGISDNEKVLEATGTAVTTKTFVIHKEIVTHDFTIGAPVGGKIDINGTEISVTTTGENITLSQDYTITDSDANPFSISFEDFGNFDELEGFKFKTDNIKAHLYISGSKISGSSIVEKAVFEIDIDQTTTITNHNPVSSGIYANSENYPYNDLIPGGKELEIDFDDYLNDSLKNELEIEYSVKLKNNTIIPSAWANDTEHNILMELVIWVPMELIADNNGAEKEFPDDFFDGVNDFLDSMFDMMESLSLEIELDRNHPFNNASLVIKNHGMTISNPLSGKDMSFSFNKAQIDHIERYGFDPEFSIVFPKNAELKIPRVFDFKIMTITLNAKLYEVIDL